MQRQMGRRARTIISISKGLRKPQADQTGKIASKLNDCGCKQKFYYDRHTKVKEDLEPNDAVRIKTPTGWRPAEYVRKSPYPRLHIVKAGESGQEYRRNTSMLMKTKESPHVIETHNETIPMVSRDLQQNGRELSISNRDLARNDRPLPTNNRELPREQLPVQHHSAQQRNNATEQIRTRSGRAMKTPSYLVCLSVTWA
ncbi:hypothetical protein DPMN_056641 [Dreissena polymorpha]|uniref:Uncharacterized protein n=1 Tax=Dreissena polymorpha TaxID=45954 RepID=A0A9D4CS33_DREPO|nr:hypothetical protein DPMN_056641 [Dreissena polymorpha]